MKQMMLIVVRGLTVSMLGCGARFSKEEKALRQALVHAVDADRKAVALTAIVLSEWDMVCVLTPYQEQVPESAPRSAEINGYLSNNGFKADESFWTLLFVIKNAPVRVFRIKRGDDLDFIGVREAQRVAPSLLPSSFKVIDCATRETAQLAVLVRNNRRHVTLGSMERK